MRPISVLLNSSYLI